MAMSMWSADEQERMALKSQIKNSSNFNFHDESKKSEPDTGSPSRNVRGERRTQKSKSIDWIWCDLLGEHVPAIRLICHYCVYVSPNTHQHIDCVKICRPCPCLVWWLNNVAVAMKLDEFNSTTVSNAILGFLPSSHLLFWAKEPMCNPFTPSSRHGVGRHIVRASAHPFPQHKRTHTIWLDNIPPGRVGARFLAL